MKIEAKQRFTFSKSSVFPLTLIKDSCCPAKDASAWSSAVADERTDTKIGSREDFRIASAPGEDLSSSRSMLKWSYASVISVCRFSGISAPVINSRISFVFSVRSSVLSTSILFKMSLIGCSSFVSLRK